MPDIPEERRGDLRIVGRCASCNTLVSVRCSERPTSLKQFLEDHHPKNRCTQPTFINPSCESANI